MSIGRSDCSWGVWDTILITPRIVLTGKNKMLTFCCIHPT